MSTVQRKVFDQFQSFMVRITFNKKYIFAGLVKKPQAGRNSGKAPVPPGRSPWAGGTGLPMPPWHAREIRQGYLGFFVPNLVGLSLIRQVGSDSET